jgi:hypothetical protein
MNIFFFSGSNGESKNKIKKLFERLFEHDNFISFRADQDIEIDSDESARNLSVAVLLPSNKDDLNKIINRRESFLNMRTILVLPDTDDETIALGQTLRPWLINYPDTDFINISDALTKMDTKMEMGWNIAV